LANARRELLRTQRSALLRLRRDGVVSDEAFDRLTAEVDARLLKDGNNAEADSSRTLPRDNQARP
jgi:hypothetical protein